MSDAALLAGTIDLYSAGYKLAASDQLDFGTADIADFLLNGDYRPEDYDQVALEAGLLRLCRLPLRIIGTSSADAAAKMQALISILGAASRQTPTTFVFTPSGGVASTFYVVGGALEAPWDIYTEKTGYVKDAVLHLRCLPFVYGPQQSGGALGSSGSPLISNTASPANVTLAPSPIGDVPGDVTLFVKNRSANAIRSLMVGCVNGNTTWVADVNQSSWTLDAQGLRASSRVFSVSLGHDVIQSVAHFTAPTLPSDRRFRVFLAAAHNVQDGGIYFRVRLVTGSVEVVGEWMSLPQEISDSGGVGLIAPEQAVDMGAWVFPPGEVGQLGAQATTVYIEAMQVVPLVFGDVVQFREALFMPDDSMLTIETKNTALTLAASSGITRVETDTAFDSTGLPAGAPVVGAHVRSRGGRYVIYTSQGYTDTLDPALGWLPENVDAWFTFTPRYLHLAS